jgi:uncharacterized RDD family membrane protein YckC
MDKPDFSKYTEEQLRQILTTIDADRFPERVQEIHARLAQLEAEASSPQEHDDASRQDGPPEIAGFWRRAGAFLLDSLLLGLVGLFLGLFLHKQFEAMGAWGRLVGFVIALAYFGLMESRIFQGRTLGKRTLDIKVIARTGAPLTVGKALLRSAVFQLPYFLNGVNLGDGYSAVALPAIQAVVVFGLGGAIVYLCIFNRRTRQSVHDLIVGALVVRAQSSDAPSLLPVWRGHIVTVLALFAVTIGGGAYLAAMSRNAALLPLMSVQQQVSRLPGVRNTSVIEGTSFVSGGDRTHFLSINAVTDTQAVDEKTLAGGIAGIVLATYPPVQQMDRFSVTLIHGYDIGIATRWNRNTLTGSPDDWRQGRVGNGKTPN